ncbi:MAG: hypothetical protein PHD97_02130, partial [Bacteroidales bacterium]|nr:hypothetical protein [Bacteroidales bacterium]
MRIRLIYILSCLFISFIGINNLFATIYYARTSGTWIPGTATAAIFSITSCPTALSSCNPGSGDEIQVCTGITLTVGGDGSITNLNLTTTTSKVVINNGFTLTVSGTLTNSGTTTNGVNGPGTIKLTGTTNLTAMTPTGTAPNVMIGDGTTSNTVTLNINSFCTNLTVKSNATLTLAGFSITVSGTTTVDGTLTISSGTGTKAFNSAVTVNGSVNFTAIETMAITGSLTMNSGSSIDGSAIGVVTVSTTLSVGSGTSTLGGITLTLTGAATIDGTLAFSSTSGTKSFNGGVTVNGSISFSQAETMAITGSLTMNS